jgi:Domain of unknown function (DUF4383)
MEASREALARARRAGVREGAARTIAQSFCLIVGAGLVAVGVLGYVLEGNDVIGFEVDGWHNVVHLATGAFLLLMAPRPASAATGALIFGIAYAAVAVWGFIDRESIEDYVAINQADNWLHLGLAAAGVVVGLTAGALGMSARREHRRLEGEPRGRRFLRRDRVDEDRPVTSHGARRE